jgi:HD superfamily phosphohydrolase
MATAASGARTDRLIRDPIFGYIGLRHELVDVVDSRLFQRLRRIGQTSLVSDVYPAATGSRFEHSLGVMYLAGRGWRAAWEYAGGANRTTVQDDFIAAVRDSAKAWHVDIPSHQSEIADLIEVAVAAVALLHDVGHPPFSHVLESVYDEIVVAEGHLSGDIAGEEEFTRYGGPYHEFAGMYLARQLVRRLPDPLQTVVGAIYESDPKGGTWMGAVHSIVVAEIDVDRLGYLMRDGQKAGTEFGAIDFERLIDSLELHSTERGFAIGPGIRARSAVETLVVQRSQSYKWIIFHPRVTGANIALAQAVREFLALTQRDDEIDVAGVSFSVKRLFGPLRPNLNYLAPSESEFAPTLGVVLGSVVQTRGDRLFELEELWPHLNLDSQTLGTMRADLKREIQASVDDSMVHSALKRACLLARADEIWSICGGG